MMYDMIYDMIRYDMIWFYTGADPAEIVTPSQERGIIGCGCNRAWFEEVKKERK